MSAAVFAPGFFSSGAVHTALVVSAVVALVAGPLGVFTVVRGQSFAGESLGDIGTTGGSAAFLVGVGPLWGFLVIDVVAVALMEAVGIQRRRGRDLATGVVLGAALGLAALFLYLDSTLHSTSNATITILFGSAFTIDPSVIPVIAALVAIVLGLLLLVGRPLLLASVSPELAAARGIRVGLTGYAYLLALGLTVAMCALTVGTILSTALLVGPAAAALRLVRRPGRAMLLAASLGIAASWLGILLAYDSYTWPPHGTGWPVSFFVVTLILLGYLLSGLPGLRARRRVDRVPAGDPGPLATLGG